MNTPIIIADTLHKLKSSTETLPGYRLPFFYLHGRAEELAGYDCCNANPEAIINSLSQQLFLADLIFPFTNDKPQKCIVFSKFDMGRMEGRIILVNDLLAIRDCRDYVTLRGYDTDIQKIKVKYPKTYKTILLHI